MLAVSSGHIANPKDLYRIMGCVVRTVLGVHVGVFLGFFSSILLSSKGSVTNKNIQKMVQKRKSALFFPPVLKLQAADTVRTMRRRRTLWCLTGGTETDHAGNIHMIIQVPTFTNTLTHRRMLNTFIFTII